MESLNTKDDLNKDDGDKVGDLEDNTISEGNSDNERNTSSKRIRSNVSEEYKKPGEKKYASNYTSMSDNEK